MSKYKKANNDIDKTPMNLIAKQFDGKGVIDFRDYLNPPSMSQYTRIHPPGDKENNRYPSYIGVSITNGKKPNSKYVRANIDPCLPYIWLEIAKKNFGTSVTPLVEVNNKGKIVGKNDFGNLVDQIKASGRIGRAIFSLISNQNKIYEGRMKGDLEPETNQEYSMRINALDKARHHLQDADDLRYSLDRDNITDYRYDQTRTNPTEDGSVFVRTLLVTHITYRRNELAKYPWYFKIENFTAQPASGKVGYNSNTKTNYVSCENNMTNEDFFQLMLRVTKYIDAWEQAVYVPFVREGYKRKRAMYKEAYLQRQKQTHKQAAQTQNQSLQKQPSAHQSGSNTYSRQNDQQAYDWHQEQDRQVQQSKQQWQQQAPQQPMQNTSTHNRTNNQDTNLQPGSEINFDMPNFEDPYPLNY